MKKFIFSAFTLSVFTGFSFAQTQAAGFETIEYRNLPYTGESSGMGDSLQRLNLVLPVGEANFALLIWIGGGAWSYGDKDQEMDLARKLGQAGIAVASVGHRLSPAVWRDSSLNRGIRHPRHSEDVASAVKWLLDHAAKYGYDPERLFIGGYSSGAHLAALVCLDSVFLTREGLSTSIFRGVIPISGVYDLMDYHRVFLNGNRPELAELHVRAVFGPTDEDLINASPVSYLENLSIPMLLMCDNNLYNYTRLFEDKIRETAFREASVVYAYNFSHGELWRDLSFSEHSVYRNIIIDFIGNKSNGGS